MSYFGSDSGYGWAAGHFLAAGSDETCIRETMTIAANHAQAVTRTDGRKVVPAGAVIPANGATAKGILYEDIDVTDGAKMGSVVTAGTIYGDRLPAALDSAAATALTGITVVTSPTITRPDYFNKSFAQLTVESAAGTAAGDTAVTVSGYSLETGEAFKYQVGDNAVDLTLGDELAGTWNTYTAGTDITATTGKKITVAALSAAGYVIGAGSATVTAKA